MTDPAPKPRWYRLAPDRFVIGLLAGRNPGPSAGPSPSKSYSIPAPTTSVQAQSPSELPPPAPPSAPPGVPPPAAALPPLVQGPDNSASQQSCDNGYQLNNVAGWGSHAGRGSQDTSCFFASSVLTSYWDEYGNASRQPRTMSAPGAVSCQTVDGALCDGSNFVMQCVAYPSDNWITCTGGKNARVYLF